MRTRPMTSPTPNASRLWTRIDRMSSPRVTVIIATYNWSTVLPYAIHSVLAQTMSDFELLVVGDGCTDDSEQVVAAIKDPRVRWINLPANTGHQAGPNNRGLPATRAYCGSQRVLASAVRSSTRASSDPDNPA